MDQPHDPLTDSHQLPPGGAEPPGGDVPPPHDDPPHDGGRPGRRWVRSRDDRVVGGVCGGLARALDIDPLLVRVATVGLVFLAGLGLFLYLGAMLLVPDDAGATIADTNSTSGRIWTALGVLALVAAGGVLLSGAVLGAIGAFVPLAAIALVGLVVWWLVSGDGLSGDGRALLGRAALGVAVLIGCAIALVGGLWATGIGSGAVAAALVIAAGAAVVVGAFARSVRWLVPLAVSLAIGVGIASAADLNLTGGAGDRTFRPASAADLRADYQLGAGRLVVDLRGTQFPAGDVPLHVRVGLGQALVLVPRGVCVASTARIGAGGVAVLGQRNGGVDVDWQDEPASGPARTRVVVDGDVGLGAFQVGYREHGGDGDGWDPGGPASRADRAAAARACAPAGGAGA